MTSLTTLWLPAAAGVALGLMHFTALGWNVALLTAPRRTFAAIALLAVRLAITVSGFAVLAAYGAQPLLMAAAGFAAVRQLLLLRAWRST